MGTSYGVFAASRVVCRVDRPSSLLAHSALRVLPHSKVLKARDKSDGQLVALKHLKTDAETDGVRVPHPCSAPATGGPVSHPSLL